MATMPRRVAWGLTPLAWHRAMNWGGSQGPLVGLQSLQKFIQTFANRQNFIILVIVEMYLSISRKKEEVASGVFRKGKLFPGHQASRAIE
ncbi:MAG TPA: hypothetical protein VGE64_04850 [Xanthomonadaceae bacterium]